jgi:hypothetical protein
MRVAIHFEDGSVAAYKLGRIVDGTHTDDLLTGKVTPITDIADALAEQAKAEYPEAEIVIERFKDNGNGTGSWVSVDKVDSPPVASKVIEGPVLSTGQEQSTTKSVI